MASPTQDAEQPLRCAEGNFSQFDVKCWTGGQLKPLLSPRLGYLLIVLTYVPLEFESETASQLESFLGAGNPLFSLEMLW